MGGNPIGEYVQAFGLDEQGEAYLATKGTLAVSALGPQGQPTGVIYKISSIPEPATLIGLAAGLMMCISVRMARRNPAGV